MLVYIVVTKTKYMDSCYDPLLNNGVYYLGYTDDEYLAESYAEQFRLYKGHEVMYTKVPEDFVMKILIAERGIPVSEISEFTMNGTKKHPIFLTEFDLEYLDSVGDCSGDEFLVLEDASDLLDQFDNPEMRKLSKKLRKLYTKIMEEDDIDDCLGSSDNTKVLKIRAKRLSLFGRKSPAYKI